MFEKEKLLISCICTHISMKFGTRDCFTADAGVELMNDEKLARCYMCLVTFKRPLIVCTLHDTLDKKLSHYDVVGRNLDLNLVFE